MGGCTRPLLCPDVSQSEKYFQLDERVNAEMKRPLTGEAVLWVLNVDSCELGAFDEEDLHTGFNEW